MRKFKIVSVDYKKDSSYFRIEEEVGFVFKQWKPFTVRTNSILEMELTDYDYCRLIEKLTSLMGTHQAWVFDNGYREYR